MKCCRQLGIEVSKMVKRKERGGRRQVLQLEEEQKPSNVQQHCLTQITYSDSSEESDEEGTCSQDITNKGKDVIDEQVADFLKEIDAISTPIEAEVTNDIAEASTAATSVEVDAVDKEDQETNGDNLCDDDITCPWQQCQDESTGYAYYWNVETNQVTWECPAEYLAYWTKLNASTQQPQAVTSEAAASSTTPTVQPKEESCEGKIIPITSYGSSEESSGEDDPPRPTSKQSIGTSSLCEYGPQLPAEQSSPKSTSVEGCQPVDERPREGLLLEAETIRLPVEDSCSVEEGMPQPCSLPSDLGLPNEGEGVTKAPGALLDYPSSPASEDVEDDHTTGSTSSASSVGNLTMVRAQFAPPVELSGTEGTERDRTSQGASDAASRTQASLLVAYGESDSEDDSDTSEPVTSLSHDVDSNGAKQPQVEAGKCFVDAITSADTPSDERRGFDFCEAKDSEPTNKIVARKKRLMSVRFVKSDEVLYPSGTTDNDSDKEVSERIEGPEEDSDFDDVLQALDDALMESKNKAVKENNKDLQGMSQDNVDSVTQESSDGSPRSDQDMMVDSPAVVRDYSDEIEASLVTIMAKLAHFIAASSMSDTIHDLAVQVQTRLQDWRAGALDPKYFWTKLQEVHDALQLREASMSLPCDWSCHWDSGTMRYFYTDNATGHSHWELPCNTQSPKETSEENLGQASSTVENSAEPSGISSVASLSPSVSRGEESVEEFPSGEPVTAPVTDTQPPQPADSKRELSRCSDELVVGPSKRRKTKLSSGLALRKKNIPSLLEKWEKIKKEQQRENSKQNI
ncbi:formin-binding protein 4-like isoform X2 [Ornithodoros turicata]|uniref:formin-binding protein 4-like isoform X2 n=1 Tax=Ornithodoros turicata TaxID=34597 RepID=UPI00313894FA